MKLREELTKEKLEEAYINQNLTKHELVEYFDNKYSQAIIDEHLNYYQIRKPMDLQIICRKRGCLKKYGVDNPQKAKEVRAKTMQTCLERYGAGSTLGVETFREKAKQTKLEKYGVDNLFKDRDRIVQSYLDKYGVTSPSKLKSVKAKARQTKLDRYGDAGFNNREKAKETCKEKYGGIGGSGSSILAKMQQTCMERYGVVNPQQNLEIRSKQSRSAHKSSLETYVKNFFIENNIKFKEQYGIKADNHSHNFDFALYKNETLIALVDCDGLFYHGYITDEDGKYVNTYVDDYRSTLVPDNVKFFIILDTEDIDNQLNDLLIKLDLSYENYLENIFNWCRSIDFPYPRYSDNILLDCWRALIRSDVSKFSMKARYGEKLILHYHPSIWKCNKLNRMSPYGAWFNDEILKRCIKNRLIYKGNNLDPSKVLTGFSYSGIAPKISIFNPYLAKYLILKYLNDFNTIFDPCSGFSGRLLGTAAVNKYYIGQDINITTINESNKLKDFLALDAELKVKDSINDSGEYECLFTCPPYGNKENWNQKIEVKSSDEWIDICLKNYKCQKYLFIVDNTEKYKDFIVEDLTNKSHFGTNTEYVVLISK